MAARVGKTVLLTLLVLLVLPLSVYGRGYEVIRVYDGDTLDNPKGWLEALDGTPGAIGIMYTTWQNKYGLLADFGDNLQAASTRAAARSSRGAAASTRSGSATTSPSRCRSSIRCSSSRSRRAAAP